MQRSYVSLELSFLNTMLLLQLFKGYLNVFAKLTLLSLVLEQKVFDFLFIKIDGHDVILLKILNLPFLVDQLAFSVFDLFFSDDPVVVDLLTFLLEVRHQFLFFLHGFLQLTELLPYHQLPLLRCCTLYSYDSVSFMFWAWFMASCYSLVRAGFTSAGGLLGFGGMEVIQF